MRVIQLLFDDKRLLVACLGVWTLISTVIFGAIMLSDNSNFLSFGPNPKTVLFGSKLDTWWKWWGVAIYTFVSTAIAAFSSDAVYPWITNTIQDHKTKYIPYTPFTCILIIQIFTIYAVIMSVIGLFVALSQIDFMLIRLVADLIVNHFTTIWFLRDKTVNRSKIGTETEALCELCQRDILQNKSWDGEGGSDCGDLEDFDLEVQTKPSRSVARMAELQTISCSASNLSGNGKDGQNGKDGKNAAKPGEDANLVLQKTTHVACSPANPEKNH